jgi:signal transduction histidine kinase
MKFQRPVLKLTTSSQFIVTAVMLLLLPLLALLQYKWQGELSASSSEQMKTHLQSVATRFAQEFDQEITRTYVAFMPFQEIMMREEKTNPYVSSYNRWSKSTSYPGLVKSVFLALTDDRMHLHLHELDREARKFEARDWPQTMTSLRQQLEEAARNPFALGPTAPDRTEPPSQRQLLDGEQPAMVMMLVEGPLRVRRDFPLRPPLVGFAIVVLDLPYIQQEILPSMIKRHFLSDDGSNYDITIVSSKDQKRLIYQSVSIAGMAAGSSRSATANADASAHLFSLRPDELRFILRGRMRRVDFTDTNRPGPGQRIGFAAPVIGPGFWNGAQQGLWQIRIRHRAGSLAAAVDSVRRRNLLISFGILTLLGASVALLIISARRARRLAEHQIDFVAGVSHELRTPLAVIESAAYNLDKGVISAPQQVRDYGALIRYETRRLKEMVEQILELAGAQSGRMPYNLQAVSINQILDDVLSSAQPLLAEDGFQIENDIDSDLPPVMADRTALARAIQNLINNAMKYSGESKWIGLKAKAVESAGGRSVQITVSDQGIGIPEAELSQIFEPFYRGSAARAAQIHGNGLGLSLIKNIIAAHRGTIDVKSTLGTGSSFIINLLVTAAAQANNKRTSTVSSEVSYE